MSDDEEVGIQSDRSGKGRRRMRIGCVAARQWRRGRRWRKGHLWERRRRGRGNPRRKKPLEGRGRFVVGMVAGGRDEDKLVLAVADESVGNALGITFELQFDRGSVRQRWMCCDLRPGGLGRNRDENCGEV